MASVRLWVIPKYVAEDIGEFGDKCVISITTPGCPHADIRGDNVYRFEFYDILSVKHDPIRGAIYPISDTLAKSMARAIVYEASRKDDVQIVVHCEAGVSRSPAVALAISDVFKTYPSRQALLMMYPLYNKAVRDLVSRALTETIKERGI